MVQRNGSKKPLRSPQQQEPRSKGGGGGGGETKVKRLMSIKITDLDLDDHVQLSHHPSPIQTKSSSGSTSPIRFPNYMKPTTSSDAKKDTSARSSDAKKKPVKVTPLHLPPLTSSASQPARIIKRKPSLKAIKISMKKSSLGTASDPSINKATCSSALKDSRFPKALDLNPGGTEAEGTSVMKVCPYKFCSLNGHCHEPLPPLKCFLSSRRQFIKAQRSLNGLPSFRKDGSRRVKKENDDTGQPVVMRTLSNLEITSLIEEIADQFFVDIYTKPENQMREHSEVLNDPNHAEDVMDNPKCEDNESNLVNGTCRKDWDGFSRDDTYQNSDVSFDEFEITLNCLEYVNCDQQDQSEKKIQQHSALKEELDEASSECFAANGSVKHDDSPADVSLEECMYVLFDEEGSCSVDSYDDFCQSLGDLTKNTNSDGESCAEPEVIQLVFGFTEIAGEPSEYDNVTEKAEITCPAVDCSKKAELASSSDTDSGGNVKDTISSCENRTVSNSSLDNSKEVQEIENAEGEETGSVTEAKLCASTPEQMEADENITEEDAGQICNEDVEPYYTEDSEQGNSIRPLTKLSRQDPAEVDYLQKLKLRFTRNTKTEELEQMKDFNPRGPNFLPLEPDEEAEKVDLRHQMMGERRNAEEWMIDYALRQTLTKLAAARRRKVPLLVEAFETVKPASIQEKP